MERFFSVLRIYFPSWRFFDFAAPEHFEFEFFFEGGDGLGSPKWIRLPSEKRGMKNLFFNPFENLRSYIFTRLDALLRDKAQLSPQELLQLDGLAKTLIYSYEELREVSGDYGSANAKSFRYRLLLLDLSENVSSDRGLVSEVLYTSPKLPWEPV